MSDRTAQDLPITLLVADDHPVTREGPALLLDSQPGLRVVGQAANGREAADLFAELGPDVCVLDLQMPVLSGVGATEDILRRDKAAKIVLLTTYDGDEDIFRAMHAGARAYLLKDAPTAEVVTAIRTVHAGGRYLPPAVGAKLADRMGTEELTERELEVLRLVARGLANKQIAHELGISEGTVKSHVSAVAQKLGVSSRTEAALAPLRRGLFRL